MLIVFSGTLGPPTLTRKQRLVARQWRMAYEQDIARLTTEIADLSQTVKDNQSAYQSEMLKMMTLVTSAMERFDKKFEVLDLRLNETRGPSIHDENQRSVTNVRERLPEKLALNDLSKCMGSEDPLVHVKAFKGQMALRGVGKDF